MILGIGLLQWENYSEALVVAHFLSQKEYYPSSSVVSFLSLNGVVVKIIDWNKGSWLGRLELKFILLVKVLYLETTCIFAQVDSSVILSVVMGFVFLIQDGCVQNMFQTIWTDALVVINHIKNQTSLKNWKIADTS